MYTKQQKLTGRTVYLVDGARTPFLKAKGKPGPFSAADLAVSVCRALLARQSFAATDIDEVVTGCAVASPDETNISRIIALRAGCGEDTPAWTVQRNCASGLQAIDSAVKDIAIGRCDLVLAGGTDAMSRGPILYNDKMVNWLASSARAKTLAAKLQVFAKFRPQFLAPVIGLLRGLTDPVCGLSMGATAEIVAYDFGITREMMDNLSLQSHQRLANAQQKNYMDEITALYDPKSGQAILQDEGLRADTTLEKLAKLKPAYDKPFGKVTAGNSSQVSDGAAFVILASEDAVKRYNLPVLAKIVDINWGALNPAIMGLGPVHAMAPMLHRQKLALTDIDAFEINEAFAAQVLGCLSAFESDEYCQQHFGIPALGTLPQDKLNVDGGAIAMGHPIGATGARIVLHTAKVLERQKGRYGVASLCIGGGQGGALLLERV